MYQTLNDNYDDKYDNYENNVISCNDIESGNTCMICFEIDSREIIDVKNIKKTIGKCACSGYVHTECINKWYRNKNNIKCIMCNTLIARLPERETTIRSTTTNTRPIPCKVMVFIILLTGFIVTVILYPDIFDAPRRTENDDSNDSLYLLAIMVGQY